MAQPLDPKLVARLRGLEERSRSLSHTLSDPEIAGDMERYTAASRSYAELQPIIETFQQYQKVEAELEGARDLLASADEEMKSLAADEVKELDEQHEALQQKLRLLTTATPSWRCAREPAATRRPCLPARSTACTRCTRRGRAGRSA